MIATSDAPSTRPADIAAEFDAWAPSYETGRLARWYQAQGALALQHARVPANGSVLDVGCGTGWTLRQLARSRPDLSCLGIDLSRRMIETAKEYAEADRLDQVQFERCDWESPSAREIGIHDLIICLSAFHYFGDPAAALTRMRKALRPGGQLLIIEREAGGSMLTSMWGTVHQLLLRDHVMFRSSADLRSLISDAGFLDGEVVARIRRLLWCGKFYTSLVLLQAGAHPPE